MEHQQHQPLRESIIEKLCDVENTELSTSSNRIHRRREEEKGESNNEIIKDIVPKKGEILQMEKAYQWPSRMNAKNMHNWTFLF